VSKVFNLVINVRELINRLIVLIAVQQRSSDVTQTHNRRYGCHAMISVCAVSKRRNSRITSYFGDSIKADAGCTAQSTAHT
jgi:hypothetical protein